MTRFVPLLAICALATYAHADDEIVRGSVVKVEQQEIYVSLGGKQGASIPQKIDVIRLTESPPATTAV